MHDYPTFVNSRFKRLDSLAASLHHASTGICGEVQEFLAATTRENLSEELGDLDFYITQFKTLLIEQGLRWESRYLYPMSLEHASIALRNHSGELLDLTKKGWIYNAEVPLGSYIFPINMLDSAVSLFCTLLGFDRDSIRRANMEKLMARYPQGYSDQAAQERKDKQ